MVSASQLGTGLDTSPSKSGELRFDMTYDPMGSTVKFSRACEHLNAIEQIVREWSDVTTYEYVSEPDPERSSMVDCVRYVAKIGGPPLPELSSLLGDCLHNFRGVLDHMIWFASVVQSGDPPPGPKRIAFPAWDDETTYKARGLHAVSPKVREFVETLQPYHAGKEARKHPLWVLCELNNIDKHRELHAVQHVALAPVMNVASSISGPWFEVMEDGPVQDGTVLARLFTPLAFRPFDVTVNLRVTHGVSIMKTESTPSLHLGQTLIAIREAVHDVAKGITALL